MKTVFEHVALVGLVISGMASTLIVFPALIAIMFMLGSPSTDITELKDVVYAMGNMVAYGVVMFVVGLTGAVVCQIISKGKSNGRR